MKSKTTQARVLNTPYPFVRLGRGFYKALCVGEYDEQEITVQCACKRKQNLSRFDV